MAIPHWLSRAMLPAEFAAAEARARPCEAKAFAVLMRRLFDFARAFGIPNPAPELAVRSFRDALADVPEDLFAAAVDRAVAGWKWGNRLPMPADLRAMIDEDLAERATDLATLRMLKAEVDRPTDDKPRMPTLRPRGPVRIDQIANHPPAQLAQDVDMLTAASLPPEERAKFWLERMGESPSAA